MKNNIKKAIEDEQFKRDKEKIENLVQQGHLLALAMEEAKEFEWKSYCFGLKKGTLKFILNSTLDTLPTKTNLLKWGKSPTNKCPLCGMQQTTLHILNGCKTLLRQGRYTWRHDNLLHYIGECLNKNKYEVYVDIDGMKHQGEGTIPPKNSVTSDRPDIVDINNDTKKRQSLN